jgi:predicted transcriptional regulator
MEKRVEGFFEARCQELENQVKTLTWANAELDKKSKELFERVEKSFNNKTQRQFTPNK